MADDKKPSILDLGNKSVIDSVKKDTPSKFRVGGSFNGKQAEGGLSYNRSWKNGWGATAYAKAWWNDDAVIPTDQFGYVVGIEFDKEFKEREK